MVDFVRPNSADQDKKLYAELITVDGVPVYRLRVRVDNTSEFPGGAAAAGGDGAILDGANPLLRATVTAGLALKVDGSAATQPVSGPVTNAELRAAPVIVDTQLIQGLTLAQFSALLPLQVDVSDEAGRALGQVSITGSVTVTGPLTDVQLRATPVPISGTVAISGSVTVTGPLTDGQLRAVAVPVSAAALPLPANAAQEAGGNLASIVSELGTVDKNPSAFSVLDRLLQLGMKLDNQNKVQATEATLQKLLAVTSKPVLKPYTTLLHR